MTRRYKTLYLCNLGHILPQREKIQYEFDLKIEFSNFQVNLQKKKSIIYYMYIQYSCD